MSDTLCPVCGRPVDVPKSRKAAECPCGARVWRGGQVALLPCPHCDQRHYSFNREAFELCASIARARALAGSITPAPASASGTREPPPWDFDHDFFWPYVSGIVLRRDSSTCQVCGAFDPPSVDLNFHGPASRYPKAEPFALHVHHIIPRNQGGTDHPANLITLCDACHRLAHSGRGGMSRPDMRADQLTLEEAVL